MNKAQLVDAIASEAKISKADAGKAIAAFVNASIKALRKGERVALIGFGTFSTKKRNARIGRNPQTGKSIQIKAKRVTKFHSGIELNKALNK